MAVLSVLFTALCALGEAHALQFLGRVNPATQELTWSGTGAAFSFTGTTASIGINSLYGTNSAYLIVDGKATYIPNVNGTSISTPSGLANGSHSVVLRKSSEPGFGTFRVGAVTTDGKVGSDPSPPPRKIEIIGDSITVGYGVDGINPCTNTAALENVAETYGVLTANNLTAGLSIVAWSGRGVTRNYDGTDPVMPTLWTRYGANDADNSYPFPSALAPQAVVINLGTNDFNYLNVRAPLDASYFTNATLAFARQILNKYPSAHLFFMTSPLLSDSYPTAADAQKTTQTNAFKSVIGQLGNKTHLVEWPSQGSVVGCDYHPSPATHEIGAEVLIPAIKSALGW